MLSGGADLFDVVVDGVRAAESGLPGRPDPATLLAAADEMRVVPARTLVVDDAIAGITAGRGGGFFPIVAVDRHCDGDALRTAGADAVVSDLAEVALLDESRNSALGWTITRQESSAGAEGRVNDALFALSDGTVGVRGDVETGVEGRGWLTLVAGAFGGGTEDGEMVRLLPGPSLAALDTAGESVRPSAMRRTLDLRSGVLECHPQPDDSGVSTIRFVSLARPGLIVLRAERDDGRPWPERSLEPPRLGTARGLSAQFTYEEGVAPTEWAATISDRARVTAVSCQQSRSVGGRSRLDRLCVLRADGDEKQATAERLLNEAERLGFDALLAEHRRHWSARWQAADIEIEGDNRSQSAIRFALFHLLSCAPTRGEAGVAARGLTGLAYAGHVFWDADVFVAPALAATLPAAARTMVEYRLRRLDAARRLATSRGHAGARFPWESAWSGEDATPTTVRDHDGEVVPIMTGSHEEHISADVVWSLLNYVDWTGDRRVLRGAGRALVIETARYWASRIRVARDGRAHLDAVMGPDEYHEIVDDNAFTNIMVRWHLRRAARLVEANDRNEAKRWRRLADSLVDGLDATSRRYEQHAGFWQLEPLRIADIADVPVAADVLLGRRRVAAAQVIKQPDVLMAHHLLPDEMAKGSLRADLDFYLPRTAQGSSLSPAICASLLARAGRPDEALALFDIAGALDLEDLTGMSAGGLHLATFGGLWQAVVFGFAGVRVVRGVLHVDPALPTRWNRLRIGLRFRGVGVGLLVDHERVAIESDGPLRAKVHGLPVRTPAELVKVNGAWRTR
jgi:trehalose/maltose hydrolase-like predicted phosphorylase